MSNFHPSVILHWHFNSLWDEALKVSFTLVSYHLKLIGFQCKAGMRVVMWYSTIRSMLPNACWWLNEADITHDSRNICRQTLVGIDSITCGFKTDFPTDYKLMRREILDCLSKPTRTWELIPRLNRGCNMALPLKFEAYPANLCNILFWIVSLASCYSIH